MNCYWIDTIKLKYSQSKNILSGVLLNKYFGKFMKNTFQNSFFWKSMLGAPFGGVWAHIIVSKKSPSLEIELRSILKQKIRLSVDR